MFIQIFHLKYFTALHDVIFIHFLGMLKILLFPLFKQKKLKQGWLIACPGPQISVEKQKSTLTNPMSKKTNIPCSRQALNFNAAQLWKY